MAGDTRAAAPELAHLAERLHKLQEFL